MYGEVCSITGGTFYGGSPSVGGELDESTMTWSSWALLNLGSIGSITGGGYLGTFGLANAGTISQIVGTADSPIVFIGAGEDGIGIYNEDGTIHTISGSMVRGTSYGFLNTGGDAVIDEVSASTFEGAEAGIFNDEGDASGNPTIKVLGKDNVLLATGEGGHGYLNNSRNATKIEPGLVGSGKTVGTGRYWGKAGGIGSGVEGNIIYPAQTTTADAPLYHLATDSLKSDVDAYPGQAFQYLKLPFTLFYDANAEKHHGYGRPSHRDRGRTAAHGGRERLLAHGLVFAGWNTAADGSGTSYQTGDKLVLEDDTTLYAQWEVEPEPTPTPAEPTPKPTPKPTHAPTPAETPTSDESATAPATFHVVLPDATNPVLPEVRPARAASAHSSAALP